MYSLKRSLIVPLAALLAACAGDTGVNPVAELVDGNTAAITTASTITATYRINVGQSVRIVPKTSTRTSRLRWSTTNSGVASVSSTGTATGRAAGSSTVTVSGSGVLESYSVVVASSVTAPTATVTSFSLQPSAGVTITSGQTQQFTTSTTWSDGQSRTSTVTYTATGGTISTSGLFTAGNVAGTFMVIATCACTTPAIADTTLVSVVVPQLTSLTVSPKTASVATGATQQFAVAAQWSTGATTVPPVTWSATGGTVSASGLYTAPSTAGTYRVIVAHTNGTVGDTATVTVTGTSSSSPSSAFTPNLPSGLVKVTDSQFGNLLSGEAYNADSLAHAWDGRNAMDATAPFGSGVYEMFYPGNDAGNGTGGGILWGPGGNQWRRVYFAIMVWLPANYSIHTNGEKFFYPIIKTPGQADQSTSIGWSLIGTDTGNGSTFGFSFDSQIGGAGSWLHQPDTSPVRVQKGRWTRIEMYCAMNTAGQQDGVWRVWVDGQMAVDYTNVRYSAATVPSYFNGIRFSGTRGGGVSAVLTPPEGQVRRYDRLAFFASVN